MSVDKFGRFSDRKDKGDSRGPKGEGFNLTPTGDYDIQDKRLVNVGDAVENRDAVNYETHCQAFRNCISLQNNVFDAQSTRICNMGSPIDKDDAVTKHFMEEQIPIKLNDSFSIHQYRLQDVGPPVDDGDAVNRMYVQTNTINKIGKGVYNANNSVISNVATPVETNDAVNLSYFKTNTIFKNINGAYDVQNTVIQNVAPPSHAGDAVNKQYLDNNIPIPGTQTWNFKNKKIAQVADPTHIHDAVTLNYFEKNAIVLVDPSANKVKVPKREEAHWHAGNKRIKNLKKPYGLTDAVNKEYLKEALADLSYAIYKQLQSKDGSRAGLHDKQDWKTEVVQELTSWDELFNDEIIIDSSELLAQPGILETEEQRARRLGSGGSS